MKKITDIAISKRVVEGQDQITCTVTAEDGEQGQVVGIWRNEMGLWPSKDDARQPAEIAAWLRSFAGAIEKWAA